MPDPRWANVEGGITHHDDDPPDTRRIHLAVTNHGHVLHRVAVISDEAAARATVDLVSIVLDDMVRELDEALHA